MQQAITLGSFILFTGAVGLITWLITRRDKHDTSDGYFLGGRTLTAGFIAGSLLLTNLSTEQLVGLNGDAFADGLCVMAWEVIAAMSLVLMALYFLPRYLRSGIATVPQFLEERFGDSTRTITSIIFIVAYAFILLPIILFSGSRALVDMLDLDELFKVSEHLAIWVTVWLIGVIGSIYAIFGGLRTVAVSDTINAFGLLVGGMFILWLGLEAVNPDGPLAALETLNEAHPGKFNSLGPDPLLGGGTSSVPFTTLFTGVLLLNLFYWCTNQQIIQRTFGASSLKEGQKGVLLAGVFKVLAPLILVLPGIIAFHLLGDQIDDRNKAYGELVKHVLPHWATGFFAAVVIGAILSSFNSALNSTATLFSLGVYKDMFHRDASDAQVIRSGKVFGALVAIAAMIGAPFLLQTTSIFGYLQKMNGLYFIPIFSVVVVGMLSKRVPKIAADVALLLGFTVIACGYFIPAVEESLKVIDAFHFLGAVFVSLVALMLVIGLIDPRETDWVQRDAKAVDLTPWPLAWPVGLGLVLFVLSVYVYLADFSTVTG